MYEIGIILARSYPVPWYLVRGVFLTLSDRLCFYTLVCFCLLFMHAVIEPCVMVMVMVMVMVVHVVVFRVFAGASSTGEAQLADIRRFLYCRAVSFELPDLCTAGRSVVRS